jgi:protein-arginine kinase activator protein McsA
MISRNHENKHVGGIPASRSSIKRLENEVKKLRNQLDNLVAMKIYKPDELRATDAHAIEDLRSLIDKKEATILQLKLML